MTALHARTEGWGAGPAARRAEPPGPRRPRALRRRVRRRRPRGRRLPARRGARSPAAEAARVPAAHVARRPRSAASLADALTGEGHGADTLADARAHQRVRARRRRAAASGSATTACSRSCCARAPSASSAASCRELHARAARWYAERGAGLGGAASTPSPREEWDLAVEVVAEHWFELFVRGDARRDPRARRRAARRSALRARRRAGRRARLRRARRRRHRGRRAPPRARRARPPTACPPSAAAATWRRWRSPACTRASLEGDFEAALEAADELLAEAAAHGGWSDDARQALVHAMLGEHRAVGAPARPRRARSSSRARHARAQAIELDYVAVSRAQRARAARRDGARARPATAAHAHAGDRARRAARLVDDPADGVRAHRRSRCAAFYDLRPAEAAEHLARARDAASRGCAAPRRLRDRPPRRAHGGRAGRARATACACSTTSRSLHRHAARRRRTSAPSLAAMRARLLIARGRPRRGRARCSRRSRDERWLDVDVTAARLRLAARRAGRRGRDPRAPPAGKRGTHAVADVEHAVLEAIARDEAGEPRPRGRGARARRSRWPRRPATAGRSWRSGGAMEDAAAPPDPHGHRAPRDRRRAAGRVRRPRAGARARRAAAGAAERARAGDPALPADDALQPRDRRRAVRHDQHGQDAPAQHLPQARRRPPPRGRRARARPTAALRSRR